MYGDQIASMVNEKSERPPLLKALLENLEKSINVNSSYVDAIENGLSNISRRPSVDVVPPKETDSSVNCAADLLAKLIYQLDRVNSRLDTCTKHIREIV